MKTLVTILVCLMTLTNYAQDIIIDYYPPYKEGTSKEDYDKGKRTLDFAYKQEKESKNSKKSVLSYFMVANAYTLMSVDKDKIYALVVAAKKLNSDDFCEFINLQIEYADNNIKNLKYYKTLGDRFLKLAKSCASFKSEPITLENLMKKKEGYDLTGLNEALIDRIIVLLDKDRFRTGTRKYFFDNVDTVKILDKEVEEELITLFDKYGYIGKDLVGEHYQSYMCLLLEHCAKLPTIEKYFPVVAEAYKNNQLEKGPFRMLIDRLHVFRDGVQIFGSHSSTPLADEKVIAKVKSKYNL